MLRANVNVRSVDSALEHRPEPLNPIYGLAFGADIFADLMPNLGMRHCLSREDARAALDRFMRLRNSDWLAQPRRSIQSCSDEGRTFRF